MKRKSSWLTVILRGHNLLIVGFMFICIVLSTGCTENQKAKKYGGSTTYELPKGQKLINITWKDNNIWYLTRPMNENETAEIYTFQEESSYGVWEGTVTIKETK